METVLAPAPVLAAITEAVAAQESRIRYANYSTGKMGLVLFYSYLAACSGEDGYRAKADRLFGEAISALDPGAFGGNGSLFYKELAEIGVALHHLETNGLLRPDAGGLLNLLDELLYPFMQQKMREGDLNEVTGALAAGQYFLTRLRTLPAAETYLRQLVRSIEEHARHDEQGRCYWKWPVFKSDGVYLGLIAGSAMQLSFLASVYEAGLTLPGIVTITERAAAFVLGQKRQFAKSFFPIKVGEPVAVRPLLQGDLGICYGLLRAASVLQSPDLHQETCYLLEKACERRADADARVTDASVLYGASGVALLLDRAYALTGRPALADAAGYWYGRIGSFARHQNECAGFRATFNQRHPHTNVAFDEGIVGIGITLMHHTNADLPHPGALAGLL